MIVLETIRGAQRFTFLQDDLLDIESMFVFTLQESEAVRFLAWTLAMLPTHAMRKRSPVAMNYQTTISYDGRFCPLPNSGFIAPYLEKDANNRVFRIHPSDAADLLRWSLRVLV